MVATVRVAFHQRERRTFPLPIDLSLVLRLLTNFASQQTLKQFKCMALHTEY